MTPARVIAVGKTFDSAMWDQWVSEAGAGAVDMMRTLKRALDPDNILNPGKIFAV